MLFTGILLLLISNAVTFRRDKSILFARLTILILTNCSILLYSILSLSFLAKSISLFGGLVYCKTHTLVFTLFIFALTMFILSLSSFYPRKVWHEESASLFNVVSKRSDTPNTQILNKMGEQFRIIEYPLIILFVITGATFLIASSDLVTIFLAIELQSYGLYLLSTIYRNSELSTNAGLTYFLLGGLSSCIILLGQSLLYINSGNTNLDGIYIINSILVNNVDAIDATSITNIPNIYQYYIQLSFVIMSVGLLFKISSAPFHFWSPDVYDAIPTIVTTFVAIIAKISILILLLEFIYYTSITMLDYSWKSNLLLSAFLSLIIGSVLGLTQFRIKRLFAYSTISHIGFILLALTINTIESIQAFFFYIMQYSISNLNAFIILITIGYTFVGWKKDATEGNLSTVSKDDHSEKELKDKNLSPIQLIHQLKGYFYMNPLLSISLAITLFSFIGVPPLLGFFAKQMILSAALDNGYVFMSLLAILTSVISAVYYLVVIQQIFFEKKEYSKEDKKLQDIKVNNNLISSTSTITLSSSLTGKISVLTLTILLFIFIPKEILCLNNIMSILLFYN
jgi:NADH-ubiquinone oxidoreductase chain 2